MTTKTLTVAQSNAALLSGRHDMRFVANLVGHNDTKDVEAWISGRKRVGLQALIRLERARQISDLMQRRRIGLDEDDDSWWYEPNAGLGQRAPIIMLRDGDENDYMTVLGFVAVMPRA